MRTKKIQRYLGHEPERSRREKDRSESPPYRMLSCDRHHAGHEEFGERWMSPLECFPLGRFRPRVIGVEVVMEIARRGKAVIDLVEIEIRRGIQAETFGEKTESQDAGQEPRK